MSPENEVLVEGNEALEVAANGKKKRGPLTDEQKKRMQDARKSNEIRRFANTKAALIGAHLSDLQPDVQKLILTALEGKASREQLQEMVDAQEISPEFMATAIDCGVIKKPASAGKESLPYKWGSFRDYTEGVEASEGVEAIAPNPELQALLIELTGRVDEFRTNNKPLFDAIAEHTEVQTAVTEAGSAVYEGAEWMDYFRFPEDLETQSARLAKVAAIEARTEQLVNSGMTKKLAKAQAKAEFELSEEANIPA